MALMPVCSGSLTPWRWTTEGAWVSSARRADGLDLALAVERVAQRVDDPAEEAVADRHREDLAGTADRLALLDAAELAEHDGADLADVEVQRQAEGAVLELEQLVGHRGGQALDARDAVTGLGDVPDLFALGGVRLVGGDEALERVPDLLRPDGELGHGLVLFRRVVRAAVAAEQVRCVVVHGSAHEPSAGFVEAGHHGAVDDLVTDLDPDAAHELGVELDVEVQLGP